MVGLHDVETLLKNKPGIVKHSMDVAREIEGIAELYSLDPKICEVSALCHDLGGIYSEEEMLAKAGALDWPLDPAEIQHPFLLHQHFSKRICRE